MPRHRLSQRVDTARLWPLMAMFAPAALAQLIAGFSLLGLYGDGAYCLRAMLQARRFACIEAPRRASQMLLEAPTIVAERLGMHDLHGLATVFSLTLQLAPLLLTGIAVALLWRVQRQIAVLAALHYLAGGAGIASNGLIEGPLVTAYFWLLLALLLSAGRDRPSAVLLLAVALPAPFSHEVMVMLAPLLAGAALLRAIRGTGIRTRCLFAGLAGWFVLTALVQAGFALYPRDIANRSGFVSQLLALKFIVAPGIGINVPVILGLAALPVAIACVARPRSACPLQIGFAALAAALAAAAWLTPWARPLIVQFFARNHPAFLSIPLALLALRLWWRPAACSLRPAIPVLLALALSAAATSIAATRDWAQDITAFRALLANTTGIVAWNDALARMPPDDAARFRRLDWGWTNPDLSLLLAADGRIRSIVANPPGQAWQPWNPDAPAQYPQSPLWRYCAACGLPPIPAPSPRP